MQPSIIWIETLFKVYQQNTLADGPKGHLNYEYIFHLGLIRIKTVCLSVGITEFVLKK